MARGFLTPSLGIVRYRIVLFLKIFGAQPCPQRSPPRRGARPRVQAHTELDDRREPPHDMGAEQSVLGGMLLSKDAIADVGEKLRARDFYRPTHQHIYDAILHL